MASLTLSDDFEPFKNFSIFILGFRINDAIERLYLNANYHKEGRYSMRSPSNTFTMLKRSGNPWFMFNPVNRISKSASHVVTVMLVKSLCW